MNSKNFTRIGSSTVKALDTNSQLVAYLCVLMAAFCFSIFMAASAHASEKWPAKYATVLNVGANAEKSTNWSPIVAEDELTDEDWADVNKVIGQISGDPAAEVTPEFFAYHFLGATMLTGPAIYFQTFAELDTDPLKTKMDNVYKYAHWIQLIQPRNSTEGGCMVYGRDQAGNAYGCGDPFQKPLAESDLGCYNGLTYIRCHLDCLKKYRDSTVRYTPGSCKAQ